MTSFKLKILIKNIFKIKNKKINKSPLMYAVQHTIYSEEYAVQHTIYSEEYALQHTVYSEGGDARGISRILEYALF